jgi:all-trans-retinol 13,14-reductase
MHFCHTKNPVYAETGKLLTYMTFDELRQWFGTHVGQRGDGYEEFKRRKAELLIDSLEDEIPGIRYQIESYYTSTPLTYLDYTGIPEGSMYGMAKDVNSIGLKNISSKTSIPNLLLTGQSITSHGMFGVLAGSLITCSEVISKEEILRQLKH